MAGYCSLRLLALVLALGLAGPGAAWASPEEDARARRVLALVRAVAEEYREAIDATGRIVRPIEIEEARLFLAEAHDHARRLSTVPADLDDRFGRVARALEHGPLATLDAEVDGLVEVLAAATGVRPDFLPPGPPSEAHGARLFATHCAGCHGATGTGDGVEAARLEIRPADFTDPGFMRGETPADFFHVVSVGRRRAAMPAWDEVLSVQDRWDVIAHIWSLQESAPGRAEGRGLFVAECAGCHGATGDGRGSLASALGTPVPDLATVDALARRSDAALFATVSEGIVGTPMPGFGERLSEDQRWRIVAHLRALSLGAGAAPRAADESTPRPSSASAGAALVEIRRLLTATEDAGRRGTADAVDLATDAYLRFEPLEPTVAAHDPAAVRRVEEAFLALRGGLRRPGADVGALVAEARAALDAAEVALASPADAWARFVQSAAIILREGFEVVLIVGALLAYVVKTGSAGMRGPIWGGAVAGLGASIATAVLLVTVLRPAPGAGEVLEGAAMLLAAVVLFWVSYWIISKAEAERWQRYIQGKVKRALAAGSGTALALAAFLAVYREGFETVLFYQALLAGAPAGDTMVLAGFLAGTVVLGFVYAGFRRLGARVPIRPFFLATGALLTLMAITFAGRGIHALQEAGVVATTVVPGIPTIAVLGLFPSLETLAAQGVLVALVVLGLLVTLARRRADVATAALRGEIQQLRAEAEAMRAHLATLRTDDAGEHQRALDARLQGVVRRVAELESQLPNGNGRQ